MALSVADCRKARGNAKRTLTRASSSAKAHLRSEATSLDLAAISKVRDTVDVADEHFQIHHELLYEEHHEMDEEDYLRELDEHLNRVLELQSQLVHLTSKHEASRALSQAEVSLSLLELTADAGFTPQLLADLPESTALYKEFQRASAHPSITLEPLLIKSRQTLSKRLSDIVKLCEPHQPRPPGAAPSSTLGAGASAVPHHGSIKAAVPTFDGQMMHWRAFWECFSSIIDINTHLTSQQKRALLVKAMDSPEARERATQALSCTVTYEEAVAKMRYTYEDNLQLHLHHVNELLKPRQHQNTKADLSLLLGRIEEHVAGLKATEGYSIEQVLATYESTLLPTVLQSKWKERIGKMPTPPTIDQLEVFLRDMIYASTDSIGIPTAVDSTISQTSQAPRKRVLPKTPTKSALSLRRSLNCRVCAGDHSVFTCPKMSDMSVSSRRQWATEAELCLNCFSASHSTEQCSSSNRCKVCQQLHHTLIHPNQVTDTSGDPAACAVTQQQPGATLYAHSNTSVPITASIRVRSNGITQMGRAHFDTGATITLVTRDFATKLRAHKIPNSGSNVTGVFTSLKTLYQTRLTLLGSPKMGCGQQSVSVVAHVVEHLPPPCSYADMDAVRKLPFLKKLPLADPLYVPGAKIDILLEVAAVTVCGLKTIKFAKESNLEARKTLFGWTIGGSYHPPQVQYTPTACFVAATSPPPPPPPPLQDDPDALLRQFWETEPLDHHLSTTLSGNEFAVDHFKRTHTRVPTGRYSVSLPRRPLYPALGASYSMAIRRFIANEKSLQRKGTLIPYQAAVAEYISLGHAELVPGEDLRKPEHKHYYMPMHGVTKIASTSTKLRPVCDASAKTSTGVSFNDQLLAGPSMYPRVWSLINRFRSHPIVITADISKMYRQVGLNPEERDFHRFLHRDEQGDIRPHRMTRLTFGVSSSPSIATQVLHQVATDHQSEFPAAAQALRTSFYVDDLLTGADSIEEAQALRRDLNCILDRAEMTLCKWRTNSDQLMNSIPIQLRESSELTISPHPDQALKALGVHWDTQADTLSVSIPTISTIKIATKRAVASTFARIFDPLGWFGPATIPAKLLLQESWSLQLDWDTPLPPKLQALWTQWIAEVPAIGSHTISRCLTNSTHTPLDQQLHGFADASLKALGGVVYSRHLEADTSVVIRLISSRSKLAPLDGQTVPRLELCGSLILAQLLASVASDLSTPTSALFAWTDSAIVLGWLNQNPSNLETFVANRVRKILDLIPAANWRFISTQINPADILSRGETPVALCHSTLWWSGPPWLSLQPASWPRREDINLARELPPLGLPIALTTSTSPTELILTSSNFLKSTRIFAWIDRFIHRTRKIQMPPATIHLSSLELQRATQVILKHSQHIHFNFELKLLAAQKPLPKRNRLRALAPFIDAEGMLRVGGRLQKIHLSQIDQHPLILHSRSHVVQLMLQETHRRMRHAGSSTMMASLGCTYHIIRLKPFLRSLTHSCVPCLKQAARTSKALMGQLPSARVQPSPPFSQVGVDFAGPFLIRRGYTRKPAHVKTYLCLFICLATKAVHIEVASDLSTITFLACLKRLVGRRGYPTTMYSDNGSNFIGAEPHVTQSKTNHPAVISSAAITVWAASVNITWSFSPPRSPHHGGLWEAGIKSMKRFMKSSLTDGLITYEELVTLSIEVEAILNSRPLAPLDSPSTNPVDVLTPGHFLVGRPLTSLPYHHNLDQSLPLLRRWNLVERLSHHLWQRWKKEYLVHLQQRVKWQADLPQLTVGDVVMVKNIQTFQRDWPLAIITGTYPGPDGRVRVVDLQSGTTSMK